MPVMNELLWVLFLVGFGACFGYSLREHYAQRDNQAFQDRIEAALDDMQIDEPMAVSDLDYQPLPEKRRYHD
jgi:hypothetical protein